MRKAIWLLMISVLLAGSAAAQVYTPEKGSKVRKDIIDALRVPVKKELKQDVVFVIEDLNVDGNWAFLGGAPSKPDGGAPDYSATEYQEAIDGDYFDNNIFALFRKTGGKWKVVTYLIGCTDVCYATWWRDHKAPKSIFPYTE
ncbi:MAG: hypothetical protein IPM63_11065 [Acidobacteriota bacterium]|nr:MAG: hypothetical protein IPM63_11065 [Acidobacteriota bacterium]